MTVEGVKGPAFFAVSQEVDTKHCENYVTQLCYTLLYYTLLYYTLLYYTLLYYICYYIIL